MTNILTANSLVSSTWANARDAVSAAMMQSLAFNDWVLETGTASGTDWVVTFPTKPLYAGVGAGVAAAPFNANFNNGQSCDNVDFLYYNREEATTLVNPVILPPEPPLIVPQVFALCSSANVITFGTLPGRNLLGSAAASGFDTTVLGRSGYLSLTFDLPRRFITPTASAINDVPVAPQRHFGLPAAGFMIQNFVNGNVGSPPVLSNYGGSFEHKYLLRIAP